MFSQIVKLLKALNTNSHPGEIAHGAAIGCLLGFVPKNNALWYILFVLFLFIRINKGTLFISIFAASLLAPLFDPLFDSIGYTVLTFAPLTSTYAALLDVPFVAFTKFNNTITAGSAVVSLVLYTPVYILTKILVKLWRTRIAHAIAQSKLMQIFYKTPFAVKVAGFFTEV